MTDQQPTVRYLHQEAMKLTIRLMIHRENPAYFNLSPEQVKEDTRRAYELERQALDLLIERTAHLMPSEREPTFGILSYSCASLATNAGLSDEAITIAETGLAHARHGHVRRRLQQALARARGEVVTGDDDEWTYEI